MGCLVVGLEARPLLFSWPSCCAMPLEGGAVLCMLRLDLTDGAWLPASGPVLEVICRVAVGCGFNAGGFFKLSFVAVLASIIRAFSVR